jgi:hypothetical protein
MKYAIKLLYDNGQGAYLSVKGRSSWKTKRAAQKHLDVCLQLLAKDRFLKGVVEVTLEKDFFA